MTVNARDEFLEEDDGDELLVADSDSDSGELDYFDPSLSNDSDYDASPSQRINKLNARRALEDYFEERQRREEEGYFDDFNLSLDE